MRFDQRQVRGAAWHLLSVLGDMAFIGRKSALLEDATRSLKRALLVPPNTSGPGMEIGKDNLIYRQRCDVCIEDTVLDVLKDGRDRGLWFYVGTQLNDPEGREMVLITWDNIKRLRPHFDAAPVEG